jgi:hypothetical protein
MDKKWKVIRKRRKAMKKAQLRILCPNGHLGFAPTKEESFWIGAKNKT